MKLKQIIGYFIVLLALLFSIQPAIAQNVSKKTYEQIFQQENLTQLNKYLNSTIELKTPSKEGSFSKKQTGLILKKYFAKHPVKDFKIKRVGTFPDGSAFYLCEMTEKSGNNYRVYFVSKETSGQWLINILKIEKS